MKKVIALIMLFTILLTGCSGSEASGTDSNESGNDNVVSENAGTDKESEAGEADKNVSDEPAEEIDPPAIAFAKGLKTGWNLGNTFDANTEDNKYDDLRYETLWCDVETSQEMFDMLKERGFNTVRIPVSWHNHVSGENHTISEAWLNRVKEVVDYAYGIGMYVIVNIHHDVFKQYYYPSSECYETSAHYMKCIWEQVSKAFADYDEHLIFEAINEPRLKDTGYEWNFSEGSKDCQDSADCINRLNQVFVDTVRASGGKNAERYLMVPGYCASYAGALSKLFVLPTDTVADKLMVSVHAYIPYNFALASPTEQWSVNTFDVTSSTSTQEIESFMSRLNEKFVVNGIPVVIGEYGARNKDNNLTDRVEFAKYYISTATKYEMPCLWWDNNSFYSDGGEDFGLLSRVLLVWRYEDIIDAIMENTFK